MFCVVGFIKIFIRESFSLKDKRRIIKGLLGKARREFNVSISEIDYQDLQQVALLGFSFVGTDRVFLEKKSAKLLACIEGFPDAEVVGLKQEIQRIGFDELPHSFEMGKYDV